jgi:PrcB C-terminal
MIRRTVMNISVVSPARRAFILAFVATAAACTGGGPLVPDPTIPPGAVDVGWSDAGAGHIAQGYYSGYVEPARLVIDNDADWRAAWTKAYIGVSPTVNPPAIDFSRWSVILVALGNRNTGGYSIAVTRLARTPDYLYAEVTSVSPGSHCGTTQALTQPFDIVRIPKPPGPVVFVEHATVFECQ